MKTKELIKDALVLLSEFCDGAKRKDGVGFNGADADFGNSLASIVSRNGELTDKQYLAAYRMLAKYKKQTGINFSEVQLQTEIEQGGKKVKVEVERKIDFVRGYVRVYFHYDVEILDKVKNFVPSGTFVTGDKKYWMFCGSSLPKICEMLKQYDFSITEEAQKELSKIKQKEIGDAKLQKNMQKFVDKWVAKYQPNWKFPNGVPLKLYQHQIDGLKFMVSRVGELKGCIVADDMGLGKTFTGMAAASLLKGFYKFESGVDLKIVVICPKSLKDDWLKAAAVVKQQVEIYTFAKIPVPPESRKYIVIADESHAFQSTKSNRTKKFLDLVSHDNCIKVFPLTGTPMNNGRPSNLYPLLKAINHPVAKDRKAYESRFCDAKATRFTPWDVTGAINLEELSEKIRDGLIRRTKDECLDLPEKVFVDKRVEETPSLEKEYEASLQLLKKEYLSRIHKGEIKGGGDAIVLMGWLRRLSSLYKVPQTIEIVEELLTQGESVVVFTEFVESAKAIAKHFDVQPLTGDTKDVDRQAMKEDFQAGKTKVFVGTIKAGGVGITLTKSSYNIIVDLPWTPGAFTQACDRIHRIGQTRTSFIYKLFAKDIDYVMAGIIGDKSEAIDIVLQKYDIDLAKADDDDDFYPDLLGKLLR
jgi:SNF2 family DNA or RNA helicase